MSAGLSAVLTGAGFFFCARCRAVVQVFDRAVEDSLRLPAECLVKVNCPGCDHLSIRWRIKAPERPRNDAGELVRPIVPVDPAKANELWNQVRAAAAK